MGPNVPWLSFRVPGSFELGLWPPSESNPPAVHATLGK